ncbi:Phosphoglycerate mutase-like protein [Venustampulla echinocandica]|uniref:Phosphoglycerate mutase-like protein n=1 Tax=Venustampulla echinocandica TaxID=2656787 RepID=A0A370TJJ5_9HELO|nr:Phosphoglycerate mutase-like protein [Venustampulla echinocandica]RDL35700.1 Phosphoglycerate mutase-like protein [Venustampulla echinocandica]
MAWPPAVVIVVRHGARLDAADEQWHLTSPTPYDPPLTYGGWTQSRALGQRIASILRSRETDDDIPGTNEGGERREQVGGSGRKRRHKVVIHTSPFQRCVQTSIAISAGLAQSPSQTRSRSPSVQSNSSKTSQIHASPKTRPKVATDSPTLAPIPEPARVSVRPHEQPSNIKKATIRVDAFLGEWLTPDYFELITPPPSSVMMVAGAKADLLRREDHHNLIHVKDFIGTAQNKPFPGGWGSPVVAAEPDKDDGPLSSLSALGQALHRRDRTSSLSSVGTNGSHYTARSNAPLPAPTDHGIYQPPIPSYAISLSNPIPPGYVAHARDACVNVDYQWDSMREPQNWGNGGEYGEEWSSMHKRFRKGLQQLVSWYNTNDDRGTAFTKLPPPSHAFGGDEEDNSDDEDTDLVVILVTHGAGCNALIGALTHQPVLLDVGMASLTMAVRKPTPPNSPTSTPSATPKAHSRASSRNVGISDQYDVKLVANTEHLRPSTTSTPTSSRATSVAGHPTFRERFVANNAPFDMNKSRPILSGNFGSMRRTASIAGSASRNYLPARQSSIGLWSAPQPEEEASEEAEDDMILNFGDTDENANKVEEPEEAVLDPAKDDDDEIAPLGLWGKPPGYADKLRDVPQKRRWTVNERA